MQRGARPARSFTHFSSSFLLFFAPPAPCRFWTMSVALVFHWLAFG